MVGSVDGIVSEDNLKLAYNIDVRVAEIKDNIGKTVKTCVPLI